MKNATDETELSLRHQFSNGLILLLLFGVSITAVLYESFQNKRTLVESAREEGIVKNKLKWAVTAFGILFIIIQFVQSESVNPLVEPSQTIMANAEIDQSVAAIFKKSCFDCHSNETRWPWYSKIAPASWFIANDVRNGRQRLNFSEWGKMSRNKRIAKLQLIDAKVSDEEMPLAGYLLLHADAKLSAEDRNIISNYIDPNFK